MISSLGSLAMTKRKLDDYSDPKVFADPTLDITFKMLFASEQNKDILISLLNSLLSFKGEKEILEVEINKTDLPVNLVASDGGAGIVSSVDLLCTNKGKHKIAVEMQGQKTKYFLAREQEYMAKLLSGQVKEGEGQLYHEKLFETYIIVIGKANIFIGNTSLKDQKLYELDVEPIILQTGEKFPGNKMFWKFFELPKFQESEDYKQVSKGRDLKHQWLEFLIDCSKQNEEPNREGIIKKGYEIMKIAQWNSDMQTLYWKQKAQEEDFRETQKELKKEEFEKGKLKGKIEGEIKGEIKAVKSFIELAVSRDKFIPRLKFLTQEKVKDKLQDNLKYIEEHINDSDSDIGEALGLIGDLI